MNDLVNSNTISMSLREIAEILNSNPSNLIKSAEKLVNAGVISFLPVELAALKVIKIDQRLNRIDSITLVAQNNPAFTKAIVQRLDELERKKPSINLDPLQVGITALNLAERWGFKGNQALLSADKATKALTGYSPLTLMGHTHLMNEKQEQSFTPTELGKICEPNISAIKMNKILSESGLQTKIDKKWFVTDKGVDYAQVLDTGKKHSDGTPIQQIKWYESVVDAI